MVTVSTRLDKVREDVSKLKAAEKIESRGGLPVRKWLITKHQLNAEHVRHCRENGVTTMTLELFKNHFFDGRSYIGKRRLAPFGSARNLDDDSVSLPEDEYVILPMQITSDKQGKLTDSITISFEALLLRLVAGETLVLLAPFGAGKSLTAREVFLRLSKEYLKLGDGRIPVVINLRDHWGARYADEILERHARVIGFTPREDIVVAWRAGLITLIVDGFDEMAAQVVAKVSNKNFMRDARFQALEGLRDLLSSVPAGTGIMITGRDHYFDNQRELAHALGISNRSYSIIELGEFGEEESIKYLRKKGASGTLPAWLPRKPLILGYLASKNLLNHVLSIDGSKGFGFAWDEFLSRISEREAAHGRSAMDAVTLRHLLERLALDVRTTPSGTGPIAERDLAEAYFNETSQNAGENVLMQLQRLPGLTPREQEVGSRSFIDEDMLYALQGSAMARFILEGKTVWARQGITAPLSNRAVVMAAYILGKNGANASTVISVSQRVVKGDVCGAMEPQIAADCLEIAFSMTEDVGVIDCQGIQLDHVYLNLIPLEGIKINRLSISGAVVNEITLDDIGLQSDIVLNRCNIGRVIGAASKDALPRQMFHDCDVELFDDLSTNSAIVRSALNPRIKALLTILRKLYLQAGGGRQLSAFKRGIPPGPILESITPVISLLETEGLIAVEHGVAHPVRKYAGRVKSIIAGANLSHDAVVKNLLMNNG
jgi:hypothetical protein